GVVVGHARSGGLVCPCLLQPLYLPNTFLCQGILRTVPSPVKPIPENLPGPRTIRPRSAMRVYRVSGPAARGAAGPDGCEDEGRHSGDAPGGPSGVFWDLVPETSRRHTSGEPQRMSTH